MRRLRLTSFAYTDYLEAISWYEEQEPELGREFDAELQILFKRIKESPEIFSKVTSAVRKARMPRFKFGVYFTVTENEIGILAIYHPSRNPETLFRRLK